MIMVSGWCLYYTTSQLAINHNL